MPSHRRDQPISPADARENEILSVSLQRLRPDTSSEPAAPGNAQFGAVPGAKRQIPDRSEEPALRESLDAQKSTTAASSNDVASDAPSEARDDEGNVIEVEAKREAAVKPARADSDAGSQ